jgi:homoserine trans-succinylase
MKIKEYPCLRDYDPKLETEVFLNKCISNEWKRTEGGKAKPIKKWKSYAYNFFTHWIQWNKNRSTQSGQVGLDEFFNSF